MVRWIRTSRITPGKNIEAVQFAKEIAEFGKKHGGPGASVYVDIFGEAGTIRWIADHEDLASFEKVSSKVGADPEFLQKLNAAKDLSIPGYDRSVIMRLV